MVEPEQGEGVVALPPQLRPRWYSQLGIAFCGIFYLGMATLVFVIKILPLLLGTAD